MDKGRVLFVDDEKQVLHSLRRVLRLHCRDWELFFITSPNEALSELNKIQPWLVVSDRKMLEMSGEDFLQRVKQQSPETVRVILTGDSSQDSALATLRVAHLLLPKPFEVDDLCSVLERAACLRSFSLDENIRSQLGALQALPVLPQSYQKLVGYLDTVDSPDSDEIAALISDDVAVLSKVLQLANSSFFGFSKPIYSAKDAIVRLGHELVKKIVLCVGLHAVAPASCEPNKLFEQAEKVAGKARQLAVFSNLSKTDIDRAYLSGLLHNVGALVECAGSAKLSPDLVGAFLLQLWGFEQSFVNSVRYQSEPESSPEQEQLTYQLCVAKALVDGEKAQRSVSETLTSMGNERIKKADLDAYLRSLL